MSPTWFPAFERSNPAWMPLAEAVKRAGSLETLLPHLPNIRSRHLGLRFWPTNEEVLGFGELGDFDPGWWAKARIEPDVSQAVFTMEFPLHFTSRTGERGRLTRQVLATYIQHERAAIDKLFPIATVSAPLHAGGRDPDHNWEDAAHYVDDWVAAHRPLPRNKKGQPILARAVDLMTEWFVDNDPPAPQERSIRRWIRKNPRSWWGPN
jgi:hypothetical protein